MVPRVRFISNDPGEIPGVSIPGTCRKLDFFNDESSARSYSRESLEGGFKLFAFFKKGDDLVQTKDRFWLLIETDNVVGQSAIELEMEDLSTRFTGLVESCNSDNGDGVYATEFGKGTSLRDSETGVYFDLHPLQGRIDDLVIFQTNNPSFANEEGEYEVQSIYNDFFTLNHLDNYFVNSTNPSGNDNLFWWSFDDQLGDAWEPRDKSSISDGGFEPINGNSFVLMTETDDFGIQPVTANFVSDYYESSLE